ncbi:MAG: hypothetical protein ACM3O4_02450 [Ignavibacteriales bacterium]
MSLHINKQIKIFDKLFSILIIETIFFILPFLTFWWSFYLIKWNTFIGIMIGLLITIVLNIFLFRKIINDFYNINKFLLILIHLFLSICIFGFFMGVPVFNIIPGILGGIYIGRQASIKNENIKIFEHNLTSFNIYSSVVLIFICFCSAYIALLDKYTASNLEGMFNLNFSLTNSMLWTIIIFGGILLILIQYLASTIFAKKMYDKIK